MKFRYSAIDTAYTCLEKYRLQYIEGIKPPIDSADMAFGTVLHASLYAALDVETKELFDNLDMGTVFQTHWNNYSTSNLKYSRCDWDALNQLGVDFLRKFTKLHQKHYNPKFLEKKMQFKVGEHDFEGTADFIGEFKGISSIVDFKTSAYPYDKKRIEVSEQLYLYAFAARETLAYPVEQIVYQVFIKNDERRIQTIVFPLTEEKLKTMLDNVTRMALLLTNTKEYIKNRRSCIMGTKVCEFYERCYKDE